MANNRMFIVCGKCGEHKMFMKYYPSTGWCFACLDDDKNPHMPSFRPENLELWMKKHRHDDFSFEGPTDYSICCEAD
jgi:hypothetical protein